MVVGPWDEDDFLEREACLTTIDPGVAICLFSAVRLLGYKKLSEDAAVPTEGKAAPFLSPSMAHDVSINGPEAAR